MTRIAVASDDGQSVAPDFRTARMYVVLTVEDGRIAGREERAKIVGAQPVPDTGPRDPKDHFAGHRVGPGPRSRHDEMAAAIGDCDAVLAGEMTVGARSALKGYGIEPVIVAIQSIDDAIGEYLRRVGTGGG